jgi:TRAP-type C4-dicarboxylate transport system substrate-binding protein
VKPLPVFLTLVAATAHADPALTLRMATIVPDGTSWARELKALSRAVEAETYDELHVKWYFGGVAGDDVSAAERVLRNQLDGIGSGGMLCERLSPTMRAAHMLAETRDEMFFLLGREQKAMEEEFRKAGYVFTGAGGIGPDVLFTRQPVRSLDELKRHKLWVWSLDDVSRTIYSAIGLEIVSLPVAEAYRAYEDHGTDGFVAIPAAALAFQWSAQARYVTDLRMGFVAGCILVAQRVFDSLKLHHRDVLRSAIAKLQLRWEDLGKVQDDALLNAGLFARQGLQPLPPSDPFRRAYREAARDARAKVASTLVPPSVLAEVQARLDEYRLSARGDRALPSSARP